MKPLECAAALAMIAKERVLQPIPEEGGGWETENHDRGHARLPLQVVLGPLAPLLFVKLIQEGMQ